MRLRFIIMALLFMVGFTCLLTAYAWNMGKPSYRIEKKAIDSR